MKLTLVLIALLFARVTAAQSIGDSLIVHMKNGQRVAIPLADIRKITFDTLGTSDVKSRPPLAGGAEGEIHPNPLHTHTTIDFDLLEASPVTIEIYDSKGTLVRVVRPSLAAISAGHNEVTWDGLDEAGSPVTSGTYFFEVRARNFTHTRKALVVR